jgi:hypothetical protein
MKISRVSSASSAISILVTPQVAGKKKKMLIVKKDDRVKK